MEVTSCIVAPHTHLARHDSLAGSLDGIFREHHVPPAILQHSFIDRRPATHYTELVNLLTPFPTNPTSELLEDIGRAVAPAQTRFTTLLSSHYPPVFPPVPATTPYALPNEEKFVVARSLLQPVRGRDNTIAPPAGSFATEFESTLIMDSDFTNQVRATINASFLVKTNPDKPSTATLTIDCPSYTIYPGPLGSPSTRRHAYALHSLSAVARQDPATPTPFVLTPHFAPRDPRFERMCNGLRHECMWLWEVLDEQLRASGVGADADTRPGAGSTGESGIKGSASAISKPRSRSSQLPTEQIIVAVPLAPSSHPNSLQITFTATLASTAGLDAIDAIHRTGQWSDRAALERLQRAFDDAHPAMQVVHHVVRIDIPDVGELVRAELAQECEGNGGLQGEGIGDVKGARGVYASVSRPVIYSGEVCIGLDRDASVVGRRGDEDEEGNSDEDQ